MLRRIAGVIAGIVILVVIIQLAELAVHAMHPFPAGADEKDFEQIKKFVASLPLSALLLVLAGHLLGTLLGCFTAARIALRRTPAYVVAGIALAFGIVSAVVIPQPIWFSVASFVIYIGSAIIGARLGAPAPVLPRVAPQA